MMQMDIPATGETKRYLAGLRPLRIRAGLKQTELAQMIGTSKECVRAWERGEYWPSASWLPKLAEALSCSLDDLYSEEQEAEA